MKTFEDFTREHPGLDAFVVEEANSMMLLTGMEGEVYWANEAFQKWIGYSNYEFTRSNNPITWIQFTVPSESLEADVQQAKLCVLGDLDSYRVRKEYLPNNQHAQLVEIYVRRFPKDGDFEFFVVEVEPLYNGHEKMARTYEALVKHLTGTLGEVSKTQEDLAETQKEMAKNFLSLASKAKNPIVKWLEDNPKYTFIIIGFIAFLVFGEQVVDFIKLFKGDE